jgi:hypothetical protein
MSSQSDEYTAAIRTLRRSLHEARRCLESIQELVDPGGFDPAKPRETLRLVEAFVGVNPRLTAATLTPPEPQEVSMNRHLLNQYPHCPHCQKPNRFRAIGREYCGPCEHCKGIFWQTRNPEGAPQRYATRAVGDVDTLRRLRAHLREGANLIRAIEGRADPEDLPELARVVALTWVEPKNPETLAVYLDGLAQEIELSPDCWEAYE